MKSKHLSETDIQEYILGESDREMYVIEHLKECRRCKAKTEMYRQLFLSIKAQPKPEFDFDLSGTVLPKITPAKFSLDFFLVYLLAGAGFTCIAFVFYLFRDYVAFLFSGFSAMLLALMLAATLAILIFQSIDLIRKYDHKMDELNFY
ncbi:MAG TPA: hypothetical protein VFG46_27400 [Chryseolinea sp.]|nr:hypothetical protein [Chryseolinea sp.]